MQWWGHRFKSLPLMLMSTLLPYAISARMMLMMFFMMSMHTTRTPSASMHVPCYTLLLVLFQFSQTHNIPPYMEADKDQRLGDQFVYIHSFFLLVEDLLTADECGVGNNMFLDLLLVQSIYLGKYFYSLALS